MKSKKEITASIRELIDSHKGMSLSGSEIDFLWEEALQYGPENPSREDIKSIEVKRNWAYNRNTWGLWVNGKEFWSWTKGVRGW